jgi:hypothetical protein
LSSERADEFAQYAGAVARDLYGEPNAHLSNQKELRFGKNGSMSVDLERGTFYDHSEKQGGGVLWAIGQATGRTGAGAVEWMREKGFDIEDRRPAPPPSAYAKDARPATGGSSGEWTPPGIPDHAALTAAYDYRDADGKLVYQVVRYDWTDPDNPKGHSKDFRQRRPDPSKKGGWSWKVRGLEPLPYRLPELRKAVADGLLVFVTEGEKAADRLIALGIPATTNSGGAGKFPEALVEHFRGAKVIILPDNDTAGEEHLKLVGSRLLDVATSVKSLTLPGLPPKGDVVDWLDAGGDVEALYDLSARAVPFEPVPFESRFRAVTWQDLDEPGPAYEHLVKGVLTRGEMSMTAGASGSGKTFLILELAMCVARGVPFFGNRVRKAGVVYQAGEGARALRRKRLKAYRQHHKCAHESVPFVLMESPIDLYGSEDQTEAFIEECRYWSRHLDHPVELIVIDTFSKATPGINENDSGDIGRVLERCDRIRAATGAHVMLVHHMNAEGAKPRGHTSMLANIETVIITKVLLDQHDKDGRKVHEWALLKQKEGEAGKAVKYVLPQVVIGKDEDGDRVTSCIVAPPSGEAGAPLPTTGAQVGGQTQTILKAIYDATEAQGEFPPPGAKLKGLPRGGMIVHRRQVAAWLKKIQLCDDDAEKLGETEEEAAARRARANETRRKAFQRARDLLYSRGIIGIEDDYIWLTGKPVKGFPPPPGTTRSGAISATADQGDDIDAPEDLPFDVEDFR